MDPQEQQPNPPVTPTPSSQPPLVTPATPPATDQQPTIVPPEAPRASSHKKLALTLLIGPTVLFVVSILAYAIVNAIVGSAEPSPSSTDLFAPQNPITAVVNVILFLVGIVGILSWLPGIIIGIVLLAKKK